MSNLTPETLAELRRVCDLFTAGKVAIPLGPVFRFLPDLIDAAERLAEIESVADPTEFGEDTAPTPAQMWAVLLNGPMDATLAVLYGALRAREAEVQCHAYHGHITAERDALAASVARVRALHNVRGRETWFAPRCRGCAEMYPCPTIRALDT